MVLAPLAFAICAAPTPARSAGSPSITTDKLDYAPGETVTITGSGWQPSAGVHIVVDDDSGHSWSHIADVTTAGDGRLSHQVDLPLVFLPGYVVTATGPAPDGSQVTAVATFTDAAEQIDFTQCANDSGNDDVIDDCTWTSGGLNANNALVTEGSVVGQRLIQNIGAEM